jgi:Rab-GTPase-TBC domain
MVLARVDAAKSGLVDEAAFAKVFKKKRAEADSAATDWPSLATATHRQLTKQCRSGVSSEFRAAVWLKALCHADADSGSAAHIARLESAWLHTQKAINSTTVNTIALPQTRRLSTTAQIPDCLLNSAGQAAAHRIVAVAKALLPVDGCPSLQQVVRTLLLFMPEGCAYGALEALYSQRPRHLPHSRAATAHICGAFAALVRVHYPNTHAAMVKCGALAVQHLTCIFEGLLTSLLQLQHAMAVWDAWMCEGSKVLFRYGLGLLAMFKRQLKALQVCFTTYLYSVQLAA